MSKEKIFKSIKKVISKSLELSSDIEFKDEIITREYKDSKIAISFSGGKDSFLLIHKAIKEGFNIKFLFHLVDKNENISITSPYNTQIIIEQAKLLGIELKIVQIEKDYKNTLKEFIEKIAHEIEFIGMSHIDPRGQRDFVAKLLVENNLSLFEPLCGKDSKILVEEIISLNIKSKIIAIDKTKIDKKWLGKNIDYSGENGEYQTFVYESALFNGQKIIFEKKPYLFEIDTQIILYLLEPKSIFKNNKISSTFDFFPNQIDICFSEKCNLDCDYCFVDKTSDKVLNFDTIKRVLDIFLIYPNKNKTITFTTSESLIYMNLLKESLEYIEIKSKELDINISIILTTNGVLLNDKIFNYLFQFKNNLQLNISWDGKPTSHDKHRVLNSNSDKKKSSNLAFKNYLDLKDKTWPRVIFTITPSEVNKLFENVKYILDNGYFKIDLFPQMFYLWNENELNELEYEIKNIVKYFNTLDSRFDLRLLNRLFGKTHYNKLLLGCDSNIYLFEWVLTIKNTQREEYKIGNEKYIDLEKRKQLFEDMFYNSKKETDFLCDDCKYNNICYVPLPIYIWSNNKQKKFIDYYKNFCKISKLFINNSNSIKYENRNILDIKKTIKFNNNNHS